MLSADFSEADCCESLAEFVAEASNLGQCNILDHTGTEIQLIVAVASEAAHFYDGVSLKFT